MGYNQQVQGFDQQPQVLPTSMSAFVMFLEVNKSINQANKYVNTYTVHTYTQCVWKASDINIIPAPQPTRKSPENHRVWPVQKAWLMVDQLCWLTQKLPLTRQNATSVFPKYDCMTPILGRTRNARSPELVDGNSLLLFVMSGRSASGGWIRHTAWLPCGLPHSIWGCGKAKLGVSLFDPTW